MSDPLLERAAARGTGAERRLLGSPGASHDRCPAGCRPARAARPARATRPARAARPAAAGAGSLRP